MKDFIIAILALPMLVYVSVPVGIIHFFRWLSRLYHEGQWKAVVVMLLVASLGLVLALDDLLLLADEFSVWLGVGVTLGRCLLVTIVAFAFVPALDSINNPDEGEPHDQQSNAVRR